jgi:hypothetical protein
MSSIIAAEGAIANVVGMTQMQPPVKDLRECYFRLSYSLVLTFPFFLRSSAHDTYSPK